MRPGTHALQHSKCLGCSGRRCFLLAAWHHFAHLGHAEWVMMKRKGCHAGRCSASTGQQAGWAATEAAAAATWMQGHRHQLHTIPELMYEEYKTAQYVQGVLTGLGITFRCARAAATCPLTSCVTRSSEGVSCCRSAGKTGIIADIGTGLPIVALRADMDALPIQEDPDRSHCSTVSSQATTSTP